MNRLVRLLAFVCCEAALGGAALAQDAPTLDFRAPTAGPRGMQQPANQQQSAEASRCASGDAALSAEARIAACTALIKAGQWKGSEISWAYANRCAALNKVGKKDEAFADCSQAIALDPKNAVARQIHGAMLQDRGENDIALLDYDAAVDNGANNVQIFADRGNILLSMDEADRALADFNRVLELNGKNANGYLDRGGAWLAKGEFDKAAQDFGKATEISPGNGLAWQDLGTANFGKGDKSKAAVQFRQSLKLNPSNPYAALWLFLAQESVEAGKAELQAGAAKFAKDAWPWPVVQFYLGERKAEDMMTAAKTPGEQCEAAFYAGEALLLKQARDEALPQFRNAVANCPKGFAEYYQASSELKKLAPEAAKDEAAPKPDAAQTAEPATKTDSAPKAETPAASPASAEPGPQAPQADAPKN